METTIRQFQEEVRDILNQDTWFGDHGIDWLAEDSLDIEYEIKKHLGQTGMVAVVTTPSLTYQGEHKSVETVKNYEKTEDEYTVTWSTKDEQGRDVSIIYLKSNQLWQVLGGCLERGEVVAPGVEKTVTIGSNEYKILLTVADGEPVSVNATKVNAATGEQDHSSVTLHEDTVTVNKGFDTEISLQIIENPTVNRGKPDKTKIATALDVGHHAVYTLSGYDTEHYNDFNFTTIKQSTVAGAGNKLLQVDARFRSTPVL